MTLQHFRLTIAACSAVTFAACGKSENDASMADTAVPAMAPGQTAAPGALDTNAMKMDSATRSGMDTTRGDTTRRDSTRDTIPR